MKYLKDVKEFGNIDPNRDKLLESCFEEHEAYKGIYNMEKSLIIGKKGSGKTSIFKKLISMSDPDRFVKGYGLNSYPWHYHFLQAEQNVPEQNKYMNSWKYLILLELAKILINEDSSVELNGSSDSIRILKKFLIDTYGNTNPQLTNIFTTSKKIKFNNLFSVKLGIEAGFHLPFDEIDMKELPTIIYEINQTILSHILNLLNPDHYYYICFDELDLGFEISNDYNLMIIGLIKAATELFNKACESNNHLNVCVFLRDDIYDLLKFEDKRKISQNLVSRIEWDTNRVNNTLKSLMEKRFTELLKENDEELIEWDDVFEIKRINGHNTKYDYMLDYTCRRPRDIIDFCNIILECYKSSDNNENKFSNADIIAAKESYSLNFLAEFDDEIHKHMSDFDLYIEIFKRIGKIKFNFADFESQVKIYKSRLEDDKDTLSILQKLFQFSVVGNYLIGGSVGGSKKSFKYMSTKNNFDETKPILVHSGLASTLGLREK